MTASTPATDVRTEQRQTRSRTLKMILILGALSAFGPLSIDMYLPSLPAMAGEFHAPAAEIQLTLTACVVGLGAGQLVSGPLSDTLGRRRPLLVGVALYTVFSVACALAPSVPVLILFRLLQALGGAAGLVIARAVVRDLYSGKALARFFSLLMLVMGVAPVLAPVIGGQLVRFSSWRGVFLVLTVIGALLLAAVAFWLGETRPAAERGPGSLGSTMRTYKRLLTDRVFVGHALTGGLAFATMFAYISGSSFVLQDVYGLSAQQFSLVFGANALGIVILGQCNARLVNSFATRSLLLVGLSVAVVGTLVLLVTVLAGGGLALLLGSLFVTVASIGMVMPNATALALGDYPTIAGSASALFGVGQFVVGGVTAPLVGLAGTRTATPMAIVMAVMAIAALLALVIVANRRASSGPPNATVAG